MTDGSDYVVILTTDEVRDSHRAKDAGSAA